MVHLPDKTSQNPYLSGDRASGYGVLSRVYIRNYGVYARAGCAGGADGAVLVVEGDFRNRAVWTAGIRVSAFFAAGKCVEYTDAFSGRISAPDCRRAACFVEGGAFCRSPDIGDNRSVTVCFAKRAV